MFTGLIERTGKIVSMMAPAGDHGSLMSSITQLLIDAGKGFETKPGDSIAVNGCCLTVTSNKVQFLAFDVSSETLDKTTLGQLSEGMEVNLERALKVGDRLGGHIVSGHVDGTGLVQAITKQPDGWLVQLELPPHLGRYVISKGSICIDGVSLTVNTVEDREDHTLISVMLIPTTVSLTSFKRLHEGQRINVEVDTLAKYIERLGPGLYIR